MKLKYCILGATFLMSTGANSTAFRLTEEAALDSLYARMSLPDSLQFSREFFKKNVEYSFRALREMPWGAEITDTMFLDFVLPVRTNNEQLDSARWVFYRELAPRVRDMNMRDAALEVNHWAHEKATYRPSDARTSSPTATVRTSWGRCGEESAFVTAAMRAVGIPARQVYTPRWAHTDDNHAWVEVFVDGRWHFLGGCEPEPELDVAWFNGPAARAMLMNTRTDGRYSGTEEVLFSSPYYTLINNTYSYAPVAKATVHVTDTLGNPVRGAVVDFGLYNYAEYYPLSYKVTDSLGNAWLTTGLGDLVITAAKDGRYGFARMPVAKVKDTPFNVVLNHKADDTYTVEMDLTPPAPSDSLPLLDPAAVALNEARKAREDSIRNAYMATFATAARGRELAARYPGLDADKMARIMPESYGNHAEIERFLEQTAPFDAGRAQALLEVIADKDLRDVSAEVLTDSWENTPADMYDSPLYDKYVLNPRVSYEELTPYKDALTRLMPAAERRAFRADPAKWVEWVRDSIRVSDTRNPRRLVITPAASYRHRRDIDARSRDVLFVAGARAMGIPARIDPVTGTVQYSADGREWTDVSFSAAVPDSAAQRRQGRVMLPYTSNGIVTDPKYIANFSISSFEPGYGAWQLGFDEFAPYSEVFRDGIDLDEGAYMLTTGQRLADGGVLARTTFFNVHAGDTITVPLIIRSDTTQVQVIGSFNAENPWTVLDADFNPAAEPSNIIATTGRGYYVLALIRPGHEPSAHLLNDIIAAAPALEADGRKILLVFPDADAARRFDRTAYRGLPRNVVFGIDSEGAIARDLAGEMKLPVRDTPVVIVADTFNRVVSATHGYTIHAGETLAALLRRLHK